MSADLLTRETHVGVNLRAKGAFTENANFRQAWVDFASYGPKNLRMEEDEIPEMRLSPRHAMSIVACGPVV